jgi:hypothetical protein
LLAPQFTATGAPVATLPWNVLVPNPFYQLPGVTGSISTSKSIAMHQLLNPVAIQGGITENNNPRAKNFYDALLTKAEHRFSKGSGVIAAFTWSRQFQENGFIGPQKAGVINHALGNEDRPLHLCIAPVWELPIGRGRRVGIEDAESAECNRWRLGSLGRVHHTIRPAGPVQRRLLLQREGVLPAARRTDARALVRHHAIRGVPHQEYEHPELPAWTGIQNLPGYSDQPAPTDGIANGVYQDFSNFVRTYPYSWTDVRASRVNNVDGSIYKNSRAVQMSLKLYF